MREFRQLRETWDYDRQELISDFIDVGDRVVVRSVLRGVGKGPEYNRPSTLVLTVRNGKIFGQEFFWDHSEALAAVGISQQDAHAD